MRTSVREPRPSLGANDFEWSSWAKGTRRPIGKVSSIKGGIQKPIGPKKPRKPPMLDPWAEDEDLALVAAIEANPKSSWECISKAIPKRQSGCCRKRWVTVLSMRPKFKRIAHLKCLRSLVPTEDVEEEEVVDVKAVWAVEEVEEVEKVDEVAESLWDDAQRATAAIINDSLMGVAIEEEEALGFEGDGDCTFESVMALGAMPHTVQPVSADLASLGTLSARSFPPPQPSRRRTVQHFTTRTVPHRFSPPILGSMRFFFAFRSNGMRVDDCDLKQQPVFSEINTKLNTPPKKCANNPPYMRFARVENIRFNTKFVVL